MVIGGSIALFLISLFIIPIQDPNPEWGKFWRVRPLIIVTLAGATGGAFYYFIHRINPESGWKKITVTVLSILIYIFGLWMGTIIGLDGTLWN